MAIALGASEQRKLLAKRGKCTCPGQAYKFFFSSPDQTAFIIFRYLSTETDQNQTVTLTNDQSR